MSATSENPKPLDGIKVIDFGGVQSVPSAAQLLAWYGADVIKIERVGVGDITRNQLRDIPDADALYFTMLNCNKRSVELNTKTPEGKAIFEKCIKWADILLENFRPGAMERMGFTWEYLQQLNPRLIYGTVKGFGDNSPWAAVSAYENVAQCAGGATSTTGYWNGTPLVDGQAPGNNNGPLVSAAALGDSNTGNHLLIGVLAALFGRERTGKGQKISVSMQDAVLNLCRVKLRDQQRLERVGYLEEYPQYPNGKFGDTVPRGGNAGGGGQPGWILKCKGWETDDNAYIYCTVQEQDWGPTCDAIGKPEWAMDPKYNTAKARGTHMFEIFAAIEKAIADKTKYEAVAHLAKYRVPCSPVLSMKEIAEAPDLRESGTIVEVQQPKRGSFLTINPIKFSGFTPEIKAAPLLGQHTDEVLAELGYTAEEIKSLRDKKITCA
ncbi:formyl-CoA transferase [Acetobacter pasteurianus]|uniref:Formyl-CoA:oxalate CoA-transferase n=1 Tax=Acetobacter pasteurianus NBRC 3188 TaxID=1226663 RepID=A0A401WTW6_ACEPA|nr:formyl-CoA transferase [Acetobacter pasteurianus]GCD52745.1 formyl-CoA transferase [Acetobacter pasteurianus NBRC 3188]